MHAQKLPFPAPDAALSHSSSGHRLPNCTETGNNGQQRPFCDCSHLGSNIQKSCLDSSQRLAFVVAVNEDGSGRREVWKIGKPAPGV